MYDEIGVSNIVEHLDNLNDKNNDIIIELRDLNLKKQINTTKIEKKLEELNDKNQDILSELKDLNHAVSEMAKVLEEIFLEIKYQTEIPSILNEILMAIKRP